MRVGCLILSVAILGTGKCGSGNVARLTPGDPTPVNRMLFGVNRPWPMSSQRLDDPQLLSALRALHVQVLRFPGGTVGSFWDMAAARFVPDEDIRGFGFARWAGQYTRASKGLSSLPKDQFTVEAFDRLSRNAGAQVAWVVNLATLSGEREAEAVRHMKSSDVAVSHVELGNEYEMGLFRRVMPTANDYIEKARPVIKTVRDLFPKAGIAVCATRVGLGGGDDEGDRRKASDPRAQAWNDALFRHRDLYDAWVVHDYGLGPAFFRKLAEADRPSAALAYPQVSLDTKARAIRSKHGGVPVWLTEYNVNFGALNREDPALRDSATAFMENMKNSGLHALVVAGYVLSAIESPDIYKMLCYHSLTGMDGFGITRFGEKDANGHCRVNAAAQVLAHIASLAAESSEMCRVKVDNNPDLGVTLVGRGDLKALQAAAFSSKDSINYVILNRATKPVSVAADAPDGFGKGTNTIYEVGGAPKPLPWIELPTDAATRLPWSGPITPETGPVEVNNGRTECELPPLCLAVIELARGAAE